MLIFGMFHVLSNDSRVLLVSTHVSKRFAIGLHFIRGEDTRACVRENVTKTWCCRVHVYMCLLGVFHVRNKNR